MNTVRCPACGTENPASSEYCRGCARRLDESTRTAVERQRAAALAAQPTRVNWFAIGIAVLLAAVIIGIVVGLVVTHVVAPAIPPAPVLAGSCHFVPTIIDGAVDALQPAAVT